MKKVYLGVGHGGVDSGAIGNGFYEKNLNLSIALHCRDELQRHGIDVRMSREKDEDDTLSEEIKECNAYAPDLAVDVHNNASGGDGFEAFYHYAGGVSLTLAQNIEREVVATGQNTRGCKVKLNSDGKDWFGFIRQTNCPAVLIECAFVDTKSDVAIIATEEKRKVMGTAVAKGILATLGVTYIPVPVQATTDLYRVQVGAYAIKGNADNMLARLKQAGFDGYITK